jgi:hypothetical protein
VEQSLSGNETVNQLIRLSIIETLNRKGSAKITEKLTIK